MAYIHHAASNTRRQPSNGAQPLIKAEHYFRGPLAASSAAMRMALYQSRNFGCLGVERNQSDVL